MKTTRTATKASAETPAKKPKTDNSKSQKWGSAANIRQVVNEAKRLALIRAAGLAFKARGFHNTSLNEVAAALNVTKPTLYYYIRNKQDLLYLCHDYALVLGENAFDYAREGATGLEKLQRMLQRYMELLTDDFASYSLLSDLNDLAPEQREAIQARRRQFDGVFRDLVKEGITDGTIHPCDSMLAVAWFMGSVNMIPRWFNPQGRLTGNQVAEAYTAFITRGLAAPKKGELL